MVFDIANPKFDVCESVRDFYYWYSKYAIGVDYYFRFSAVEKWLVCKMHNRSCYDRPNSFRCDKRCPLKSCKVSADCLLQIVIEVKQLCKIWKGIGFIKEGEDLRVGTYTITEAIHDLRLR